MKTLLNTPEERHAFIIGICEVFCPWPPHAPIPTDSDSLIRQEYHYYTAGRACGLAALIFLAFLVKELFWR